VQKMAKWSLMPTSMTPDWQIFSPVLHKIWSINELLDYEKNLIQMIFALN